jgi:pimeloyl-ACP methyl ester carboxylesterase
MLRDAAHAAPVVADILPALAALELAPFAARVTAPALVVWGDLDSSGSESGPTLADGLHGRRCVLPGVGHMPMLEAPYAFATALGTFLSATVPA